MPSDRDNARDSFRAVIRMTWIVLLWLAVGAAMNVQVAWVAVCLPQGPVRPANRIGVIGAPWPVPMPPGVPARGNGTIMIHPGYEDLVMHSPHENIAETFAGMTLFERRAGWPFRSLRCWSGIDPDFDQGIAIVPTGELSVHVPAVGLKGLPYIPLWPGFLANTLIYAFAGFAGVWMIRRLRMQQRIEKNECPGCGYSMEGLKKGASCPECGGFWFTKDDLLGPTTKP